MIHSSDELLVGPSVPSLVRLGRSPDADLVYRTLLVLGPVAAGDLGRGLGLSRQRVTDALAELAAVDAVCAGPGDRPGCQVWTPRPPGHVFRTLRAAQSTGAVRRIVPVPGPAPGDPAGPGLPRVSPADPGVRLLPTRRATRARLAQLVGLARHEHLSMSPEQVFEPESARSGVPLDQGLLDRGVRMRVLGVQPADPDPLRSYRRQPAESRPDYRRQSSVPMKLIVIDRRVALFPLVPGDYNLGYLEVTEPSVVATFVAMFEQQWRTVPERSEPAMPQIDLSAREHQLITLLAQGHTDASAARQMRISARSVTNILRTLMDRVGAENRFQLGLALGALRAVPVPGPPGGVHRSAGPAR
ncbi:helix-turn-helix domain-containing protein [Plantactinospora endophytica]|uniref:HTH luxR-type domain-containing protein n=1 Tax=Plantactinospora endophytica TaxID=673535 RepID=A0ABQ4DVA5_9ACTN|nr:helix-turn-helix transcriptional regulator [Plantactinospora endophytica]GIG86397.1 hypothetical protein Pen02_13330 [Plantactinospora endophytica]